MELLAKQIGHELRVALEQDGTSGTVDLRNHMQVLPPDGYAVALAATAPRRAAPFSRIRLRVDVTNTSAVTWLPTDRSGIMLAARWSNRRREARVWGSGFAPLEEVVEPGASTSVDLRVKVPFRPGPMHLELDLIDDGVRWFHPSGGAPLHFPITISPVPRFGRS